MTVVASAAVMLALVLDRAFAEPPTPMHPVAWFGRLVAPFDREWAYPRLIGVALAVVFPLLAAGVVGGIVMLASNAGNLTGWFAACAVLFVTTSRQMLVEVASEVVRESADDLARARRNLRALAGRNADTLTAGQVRSAATESAAENLADGLVGPLLAFAVCAPFSLPLAAGAATWVKAVNTMDSMLGYREKPVGWASARLDDVVMWLPARGSALLIALAAIDPDALLGARRWAGEPPSPNSGWPMAAVAATLGVRLEKPGVYVLDRLGSLPTVKEAQRGIRIVSRAGVLAYVLVGVVVWF